MNWLTLRNPLVRDPGPQALVTLDATVTLMPAMVQELNLHTAQLAPPADAGKAARTGLWILLIGLGGFLAWAALAPLDRGVPTVGRVSVETKLKAVQHLTGGIVKEVLVREGAQKIVAQQASHNLLLSQSAEIDTKPELEIYADDVSCAHGATVGQIDDAAMFYLQSRGITATDAKALLVFGFAQQVVEQVEFAPLRAWLTKLLAGRADVPLPTLLDEMT